MSTSKKIIISVVASVLVILTATVSVFALQTSTFTMSNNISFNATSIACDVSASAAILKENGQIIRYITGYTSSDFTPSNNEFVTSFNVADDSAESTKALQFEDYTLHKGEKVKYTIHIENTSSTPFHINVTNNSTNVSNINIAYSYEDASTESPTSFNPQTFLHNDSGTALEINDFVTIYIVVEIANTGKDSYGNFAWRFSLTSA